MQANPNSAAFAFLQRASTKAFMRTCVGACALVALSSLGGCASSGLHGSGTVWDVDLHHAQVRIDERTYAVTSQTQLSDADGEMITLREVRSSSSPDVSLGSLDRARVHYSASADETGTWVLHSLRSAQP